MDGEERHRLRRCDGQRDEGDRADRPAPQPCRSHGDETIVEQWAMSAPPTRQWKARRTSSGISFRLSNAPSGFTLLPHLVDTTRAPNGAGTKPDYVFLEEQIWAEYEAALARRSERASKRLQRLQAARTRRMHGDHVPDDDPPVADEVAGVTGGPYFAATDAIAGHHAGGGDERARGDGRGTLARIARRRRDHAAGCGSTSSSASS
jgi:hypothetical protein